MQSIEVSEPVIGEVPGTRPGPADVLRSIEQYCQGQTPGTALPSRAEWISRLKASERSVRWAIDELGRQGKIVLRQGARPTVGSPSPPGTPSALGGLQQRIVAITQPDAGIFDQAMQSLVRHPKAGQLSFNYHLMSFADAETFPVPEEGHGPLGYLIFRGGFSPLARRLQRAGHRVVMVGMPLETGPVGIPNVYTDHHEGAYLIVRHLLSLGHRRILFQAQWCGSQSIRGSGVDRAFAEVTGRDSSILSDEEFVAWAGDESLVRRRFSGPAAPTALVAWNDENAIRLLILLNRAGLRVPEDVSLVGYDNMPQGAGLHPALTTIDTSIDRQIDLALRLLTQDDPPIPNHNVVVVPNLVVRQSTAPVGH